MLTLTKEQLIALDPCNLDKRLALFNKRKKMNAKQALEAGVSINDLLWVAAKLGHRDLCVQFAVECAQRVAHLNTDPRVQAAIDAAAAWIKNQTEENTQKASMTAASLNVDDIDYAAYAAAYAAHAAAYAAHAVANAYASSSAADHAVNAIVNDYTSSASVNASSAAAAAINRYEEQVAQREIFLKIFS